MHPEEVAGMYIVIRFISAISAVLAVLLIYFFARSIAGNFTGFVSSIIFMILPLIIWNSRIAKPHILGMLFVLLGAWYVYKIFSENITERKYLYISSIFFGLAFGMLNVNVFSILILYSVFLTKNKFDFKKLFSREIFISTILFALVFLCTNWFLIADFHKFLRRKEELSIIFNYGNFSLIESAKFLKVFFQSAIPLGLFPLFCAGIYRAIKEKQVLLYPLIIFLSLHFLFVLLYMKHINTYIISLPFISIITAYGAEYFVKRKIHLLTGYSLIVILYLFINAGLHTSLFVRQGNLTMAGGWINLNIKQNSTVGVPGGFFSMGNFPAFSYFKYKLMHIPVNEAWDKPKLLPEYLVSVNDLLESTRKPELGKYYLKIYELHESGFFGKLFIRDKNIATENCNVFVYKRITTKSQN